MKPRSEGGRLVHGGTVEIAASQEPDGREVFNNIRFGVFVTFKAPDEYSRECFAQYGLMTDRSGWYGSLWRPFHLIGMESGISVAYAALRGEPTGSPHVWQGDVAATAKRDLEPGEALDGEGGNLLWGRLVRASDSRAAGMLPIGLTHGVKLKNRVARISRCAGPTSRSTRARRRCGCGVTWNGVLRSRLCPSRNRPRGRGRPPRRPRLNRADQALHPGGRRVSRRPVGAQPGGGPAPSHRRHALVDAPLPGHDPATP